MLALCPRFKLVLSRSRQTPYSSGKDFMLEAIDVLKGVSGRRDFAMTLIS